MENKTIGIGLLGYGVVGYYVGPVEVPMNHLISGVKENYNIVFTDSEKSAVRAFYGKGAGGKETVSSVYDDVVSLATSSVNKQDFIQCEDKELVPLERNHVFEGML